MLGLSDVFPKFVKQYTNLSSVIEKCVKSYVLDVKKRRFPLSRFLLIQPESFTFFPASFVLSCEHVWLLYLCKVIPYLKIYIIFNTSLINFKSNELPFFKEYLSKIETN